MGYFWSGWALSMVDVANHTAFHYHATAGRLRQTLLTFYTQLLVEQAAELLRLSKYLAVDAYFAKYEFVETLSQSGLQVMVCVCKL